MNISDLHRRLLVKKGFPTEFIFTVKTDNAGTSGTNQFTLPTTGSDFDCIVNWGDGTSDAYVGTMGSPTHTYPSVGTYEIKISGVFPRIFFNNAGDRQKIIEIKNLGVYAGGSISQFSAFRGCGNLIINTPTLGFFGNVTFFNDAWRSCTSLTSFPLLDVSSGTFFNSAWFGCSSLTSFPLLNVSSGTNFSESWRICTSLTSFPLLDTSSGTSFANAWNGCSSLTSFPLLDTSSGTNFQQAWQSCTSLTSFPLLNVSSGTNFSESWRICTSLTSFPLLDVSSGTSFFRAWLGCSSLTSFPLLDTSSGTNFQEAWQSCTSLTSFPLLDVSSGTNFNSAWRSCTSLTTFPPNMFDTVTAINFTNAFLSTALNETSIDNILVSINTANTSGGTFTQSGGSAPSVATGRPAIDALRARGWTVTVTGGY
jgi:hypothetical protein